MDPLSIALILGLWGFITGVDSYSTKFILGLIPLIAGFVAGLLIGDVVTGAVVGASTQLMSLGLVPIGGAVPPDFAVVTVVALLLVKGGVDISAAILAAIPAGILSMYLDIFGRTLNVSIIRKADLLVEEGRFDDITKWHFSGLLVLGFMRFIAYFVSVYITASFGVDALKAFLDTLPSWALGGLSVAGAVLPALGLGILISFLDIEKRLATLLVPFLIVALIAFDYMFSFVLLGAGIYTWYMLSKVRKSTNSEGVREFREASKELSEAMGKIKYKISFFLEPSWNYERMQALGYLYSILPALKVIYKDEEKLKEAARVHLEFFNTNPFFAPILMGINIATEEERPGDWDLVRAIKTGLMGVFAGLGDSLIYLVIGAVLLILGSTYTLLATESAMFAYIPLLVIVIFNAIFIPFRLMGLNFGYKRGLRITESFKAEKVKGIRSIFEWLAVVSIGAVLPVVLRVIVAPIYPYLLPIDQSIGIISLNLLIGSSVGLLLTFFCKYLRDLGQSPVRILVILFGLGFILGATGILSVVARGVAT